MKLPSFFIDKSDSINSELLADTIGTEKTGNQLFDEFWFYWAIDGRIKKAKNKIS
tara:strand:- start:123058 stop:123222 length:165 start_codon:yes stop_codon:yes gene_type:complete